MSLSLGLINFFSGGQQTGGLGPQSATTPLVGIDGSAQFLAPQRLRDVVGKLKAVSYTHLTLPTILRV